MKHELGLRRARILLLSQLVGFGSIAIMSGIILGKRWMVSILLGCLVSILPNVVFARRLFRYYGAQAAKQIVNNFYKGEVLKITLTAAMFAFVFALVNINPMIFLITYIATQMTLWLAPVVFHHNQK